jgi:hypothetical protein
MLPITAIIMFDLMSDKNVQSLVTYYSSQMCPQNANNQNTNSFLKYVQFACNIGFKDPLLLIVTLSLIVIALFILTTLYKVNRDRRYFLD